jgi:hypothetical protein
MKSAKNVIRHIKNDIFSYGSELNTSNSVVATAASFTNFDEKNPIMFDLNWLVNFSQL